MCGQICYSARQKNDFTLGVESQRLPVILAFDIKQSDGVEDFYTGKSDARTERPHLPHRVAEADAENGLARILQNVNDLAPNVALYT